MKTQVQKIDPIMNLNTVETSQLVGMLRNLTKSKITDLLKSGIEVNFMDSFQLELIRLKCKGFEYVVIDKLWWIEGSSIYTGRGDEECCGDLIRKGKKFINGIEYKVVLYEETMPELDGSWAAIHERQSWDPDKATKLVYFLPVEKENKDN